MGGLQEGGLARPGGERPESACAFRSQMPNLLGPKYPLYDAPQRKDAGKRDSDPTPKVRAWSLLGALR